MKKQVSILVAEDEALLAWLLEEEIKSAGMAVVGPCATLKETLDALESQRIDGAILDVDLGGEQVFPAAERLQEKGVPLVFHTGRADKSRLLAEFPDAKICQKPSSIVEVIESLFPGREPRFA